MDASQRSPSQPLVSVIIPAYNAEAFIAKTLASVLAQTYKNIEVLVVDDGSQDKTPEIVREFAKKDQRITLFQQLNSGVAAARNLALEKSKGEFIAPVDADDLWDYENLEKQVKLIQSDASVGLVYAWSVEIDEQDKLSGGFHGFDFEGNVYLPLLYRNFIGNASAVLIRKSCLEEVGVYDSQLRQKGAQGCEDWDLYLRIAEYYQVGVIREFLIGYRQVTNSMSRNYTSMEKSHQFVLEAAQQKYPEISQKIYQWSCSNFYVYLAHQSSRNGNPRNSLSWLYKALKADLTMILLRHDLYILTLKNAINLILNSIKMGNQEISQVTQEPLSQKTTHTQKPITTSSLYRLVKIRKLLPAKIYEKIRFKGLSIRTEQTLSSLDSSS